MHCYRLRFRAPFHVDGRGNDFYDESESFIHSDTLSAAILSAWAMLEPADAEQRAAAPPFVLSSAFPYFQNIYFLPRPLGTTAPRLPEEQLKQGKILKKIQWLPVNLWRQAASGNDWLLDLNAVRIVQDVLAFPKSMALEPDFKLWAHEERPRLSVDRATVSPIEGQLFHFGRVYFHPDGGLYFLVRFTELSQQTAFEAALSWLGDSGIGADRNSGNGFFEWHKATDFPQLLQAHAGRAIALSLVNPDTADCASGWLDDACYALVSRGGWIGGTGLRRQRLRLFAEGSQFRRSLNGRVVDVTPEGLSIPYRVYRDGRGFFVGTGGRT
ncbi:MAG: type III-A CRISPR-associated RAMP protein Csm4 [Gammaproteobacteria bacterium]|nr:type III-A CRISPR-associated RAMP protein Csm4 [Candidatus Competibacteraceae bacterium]